MIGWIILAAFLLFLAVLLARTLRFRPLPEQKREKEEIRFDEEAAVEALRELVRTGGSGNLLLIIPLAGVMIALSVPIMELVRAGARLGAGERA